MLYSPCVWVYAYLMWMLSKCQYLREITLLINLIIINIITIMYTFKQVMQHYSKPGVTAVEVLPVFPDFEVSSAATQFLYVTFTRCLIDCQCLYVMQHLAVPKANRLIINCSRQKQRLFYRYIFNVALRDINNVFLFHIPKFVETKKLATE